MPFFDAWNMLLLVRKQLESHIHRAGFSERLVCARLSIGHRVCASQNETNFCEGDCSGQRPGNAWLQWWPQNPEVTQKECWWVEMDAALVNPL